MCCILYATALGTLHNETKGGADAQVILQGWTRVSPGLVAIKDPPLPVGINLQPSNLEVEAHVQFERVVDWTESNQLLK